MRDDLLYLRVVIWSVHAFGCNLDFAALLEDDLGAQRNDRLGNSTIAILRHWLVEDRILARVVEWPQTVRHAHIHRQETAGSIQERVVLLVIQDGAELCAKAWLVRHPPRSSSSAGRACCLIIPNHPSVSKLLRRAAQASKAFPNV